VFYAVMGAIVDHVKVAPPRLAGGSSDELRVRLERRRLAELPQERSRPLGPDGGGRQAPEAEALA
jgi:hypothetical protein